jgi:replicative DNA helicase
MTRSTDISPLSVLLSKVDAVIDGAPSGETIPSGFQSLDTLIGGGFRRGDLVVLGGDVASGKSALGLAFAIRVANAGRRTAFISGEMSIERVHERIMSIEARAAIDDLRKGTLDDRTRASAGAVALRLRDRLPIVERLSVDHPIEHVGRVIDGLPGIELVVIDSLAAFAGGTQPLDEALASAVRALKSIALEQNVAILVTAPLPNLTARPDRRPTLDDFGALGCVKQHADVVFGLFRQDMYEPSRDIEGATELLIRKNRNGPTGYIDLYFYAQWMRFEDMLDPDR